ncbi:MAG TPA: alpha-amylase family glycosyl hydrolase, partial [Capsulimonadaceae bacterium]|nr:alpha-amylase family glycosyl hydrolase [Capsulimonadaceae bacterium]
MVEEAHRLGLKVFMDVTMHGVMDKRAWQARSGRNSNEPTMPEEHPYLKKHPEWFSRNESAQVATTYTYAFDHANASWQDFMAHVFTYYVTEYDVDGFRVDSHTWNFFPNWARALPYPASASFYGSARLFKRIRRELKAIKPEVVFYTETSGPLLHSSHELGYNYEETWMLVNMLPLASRHGVLCHGLQAGHVTGWRMSARDMAMWLAQHRLAMPAGAIKVRSLDNHDTYWPSHEFRRETFGKEAARAIVALFAFIEGGFMDFNGADEGDQEFYRKVMRLRRDLPALKHGKCDYLAVEPSERMVFAPMWEHEGRYVLPVIHLDNSEVTTVLPLPFEAMRLSAGGYRVWERMQGEEILGPTAALWSIDDLRSLSLSLGPYGIALLEIQPA